MLLVNNFLVFKDKEPQITMNLNEIYVDYSVTLFIVLFIYDF